MIYTITDHKTNVQYNIGSMCALSLDAVWASQQNGFTKGSKVTIVDEKGNKKTFTK